MSDTSLNPKGSYLPSVKFTQGALDSHWAPARSLRFVVVSSVVLWSVIFVTAAALI